MVALVSSSYSGSLRSAPLVCSLARAVRFSPVQLGDVSGKAVWQCCIHVRLPRPLRMVQRVSNLANHVHSRLQLPAYQTRRGSLMVPVPHLMGLHHLRGVVLRGLGVSRGRVCWTLLPRLLLLSWIDCEGSSFRFSDGKRASFPKHPNDLRGQPSRCPLPYWYHP